jgi:broad specificity phosphatase PhoE
MGDKLDGWKAIANYIQRTIPTARRRARELGMPVYKLPNGEVYAYESEIREWERKVGVRF